MGGWSSKEVEQVKAESFTDARLTDESFSLLNFHIGSGIWGVLLILAVMALGGAGYGLASLRDRRKDLARRAVTTLEVVKPPVWGGPGKQTTQDKNSEVSV